MSKHWRMNQGLNETSFGTATNCCENKKLCRYSWLLLSSFVAQLTFQYFQIFNSFIIVKVNLWWEMLFEKTPKNVFYSVSVTLWQICCYTRNVRSATQWNPVWIFTEYFHNIRRCYQQTSHHRKKMTIASKVDSSFKIARNNTKTSTKPKAFYLTNRLHNECVF